MIQEVHRHVLMIKPADSANRLLAEEARIGGACPTVSNAVRVVRYFGNVSS
jgi:hypothetical protein